MFKTLRKYDADQCKMLVSTTDSNFHLSSAEASNSVGDWSCLVPITARGMHGKYGQPRFLLLTLTDVGQFTLVIHTTNRETSTVNTTNRKYKG